MVTLRAMTDADVPDVVTLWDHAFQSMHARLGLPVRPATPVDVGRLQNRIRHLRGTDPEGSWVAEEDGAIVGLSQSLVRDGYWVLSLLATAPDFQGRGLGRELIERSLAIADRDGPGTIQASRDPAALALYTSSRLRTPSGRARRGHGASGQHAPRSEGARGRFRCDRAGRRDRPGGP